MATIPGAAGPGAKFPQWLYNSTTKTVSEVANPFAKSMAETVSWPAQLIFFTSDKAADAYAKNQGGGGDISNSPITKTANDIASGATAVADTATELAKVGAVASAAYQAVTKVSMWRSLGWIVLGIVLMVAGLVWLAKGEIPSVVKGLILRTLADLRSR